MFETMETRTLFAASPLTLPEPTPGLIETKAIHESSTPTQNSDGQPIEPARAALPMEFNTRIARN